MIAKERDIDVMGGNWADLDEFIKSFNVNWKDRELQFVLYDHSKKAVKF